MLAVGFSLLRLHQIEERRWSVLFGKYSTLNAVWACFFFFSRASTGSALKVLQAFWMSHIYQLCKQGHNLK